MSVRQRTPIGTGLGVVRPAMKRRRLGKPNVVAERKTDLPVVLLWALVLGAGLALNDFRPEFIPLYWPVTCTIAYGIGLAVGCRWTTDATARDEREGRRAVMHWGGGALAAAVLIVVAAHHRIDGQATMQILLLLAGLHCFATGLHADPRFKRLGIALALAAPAVNLIPVLPWTIVAAGIAVTTVLCFLSPRPADTLART